MGWQENAAQMVAKKIDCTYSSVFPGLVRIHLQVPLDLLRLIDRACQQRNVNRVTYMRRSIAMVLANDLGIPIRQVLRLSPAIAPYKGKQYRRGQADDGEGIEFWCPHPGCDTQHLR